MINDSKNIKCFYRFAGLQGRDGAAHTGDACTGATLKVGALVKAYGGAMLCGIVLTESMFAAEVIEAGGGVPFESMKVAQLKEELAVRGSMRTGLKMVLQRRLHAMLVQAQIERCAQEMEI